MSLMAANEESDPSAILNGFWVTLLGFSLFAWRYLLKGEAVAVSAPCYKMSMASP